MGDQIRNYQQEALAIGDLLYTDSNEDVRATLDALMIEPGNTVIGVTGNADLLLLALTKDAAVVRGYDLNPAQTAHAHLKKNALRFLSYDAYATLLGYQGTSRDRESILSIVTPTLDDASAAFWRDPSLKQLVREGLWHRGGATQKDYSQWENALLGLEHLLSSTEFEIALGLDGSDEQRAQVFEKIRAHDDKYIDPARINNNHYRFNITKFPHGIVNDVVNRKYAHQYLPESLSPLITQNEQKKIKERAAAITFETKNILEALEQSFDRCYLSNVVDALRETHEQELAQKLIEHGAPHSRTVYLYLAWTHTQRENILDHNHWGNTSFFSRIEAQSLTSAASQYLGDQLDELNAFLSEDNLLERTRNLDVKKLGKQLWGSLKRGKDTVKQSLSRYKQRKADTHTLIENAAQDAALYSHFETNKHFTRKAHSFYGYDYGILTRVEKNGSYHLP